MEKLNYIRPTDCDLGENWEDYFLEIRSIKKGELFYECEKGFNFQLKALEDAKREKDGWYCKAQNTKNEIVEIFVSANTQYHGPNLFRAPQFLTCDDNHGSVYLIH